MPNTTPDDSFAAAGVFISTSPGIAEYKEPEVALLNHGVALDVVGRDYDSEV